MRMIRVSDHVSIVENLKVADTFFTRLRGLIGVKTYPSGSGLLFPDCNNIHMWMMRIPIDVVFLKANSKKPAREWTVLSVRSGLKPWKLIPVADASADDVLELPMGTVNSLSLKTGEVLCIAS